MKRDSRIDKWIRWLEIINGEIYELLMLRYVFWEVQSIIQKNPAIQTDGYFYEWLAITYSKSASIGIRRQLDCDSSVITLGRLLSEIHQFANVLTVERFEALYTDGYHKHTKVREIQKQLAHNTFGKFCGKVKKHVDPAYVCNDMANLKLICQPIQKYVNKRIAHRDRKNFTALPTFNDLDRAIEELYKIFKEYKLLIQGDQYDINVAPQWNWKEVFTKPWL